MCLEGMRASWLREVMSSFAKTLPKWYCTVRGLMKSCAPISGFERPSRASLAICASCGVRDEASVTVLPGFELHHPGDVSSDAGNPRTNPGPRQLGFPFPLGPSNPETLGASGASGVLRLEAISDLTGGDLLGIALVDAQIPDEATLLLGPWKEARLDDASFDRGEVVHEHSEPTELLRS